MVPLVEVEGRRFCCYGARTNNGCDERNVIELVCLDSALKPLQREGKKGPILRTDGVTV